MERLPMEGGCTATCPSLHMTKEFNSPVLAFTHGNPEHRYEVDLYTLSACQPDDDWEDRVVGWLRRLHAYEAGR
jgi:hypothetical protein